MANNCENFKNIVENITVFYTENPAYPNQRLVYAIYNERKKCYVNPDKLSQKMWYNLYIHNYNLSFVYDAKLLNKMGVWYDSKY